MLLVRHEMTWALAWYIHQQREWERRRVWAETQCLHGHRSYAEKQAMVWKWMKEAASTAWGDILSLPQVKS